MNILVAGGTGYIGRRLVPQLLSAGHQVRALARAPERARSVLPTDVHVVRGDVLEPTTLGPALDGIDVAYYLVHSMEKDEFSFEERDRQAARAFGHAAKSAAIQRIIYLGGLGDAQTQLSAHLRSRQEVGALLADGGVAVTEFRAGVILGAGSVPFEMLRELTERLPVMICPRWVTSPIQPIAIADVLRYLVGCLSEPATTGRVLEIGGAEVLTYQEMMQRFAQLRGLRRLILRVPVLTPRLSSYWVDIVTAVPASVARPLIEGLKSAVVVRDPAVHGLLAMALTSFDDTVVAALAEARPAASELPFVWLRRLPTRLTELIRNRLWPSVLSDRRVLNVAALPEDVYAEIVGLGGRNGWYYMNWAWRLRGAVDRRLTGPGIDWHTSVSREPKAGDRRDFWQVIEVEPGRRLRLRALMRLPGVAELEWTVTPQAADASSRLYQTARFQPTGILGRLYWYALLPAHLLIFRGLGQAVAQRASRFGGSREAR